ncbi:helix-turn-helix transcriptional regulator [Solwaraspora sp. WMMD1047]|uniref:helix-turn-helix domain-containing protein n=1 Tax=Solwaraspora sp. WMMD1047 TaxID=3016102 RepID=UPI002415EBAE|nr:helix-turn-helix transcriptional regulator [Solwaraspora sp. WMMD1047]MDG4833976.1 helix-turn-helix transcriptional regulator [Solwaraspora sp. WMMD1047]
MITGQDLRAARESRGVGLGKLADMIGRDKGHLSRVERNVDSRDVTPALVRDYEQALGLTVAATALSGGEPSPAEKGHGRLSKQAEYLDEAPDADDAVGAACQAQLEERGRRGPLVGRDVGTDPEDIVRRRILLQHALTALAAGAVTPALDVIRSGLVSSLTGKDAADVDVDEWEEVAFEYGGAYFTDRPAVLVSNLAADLVDLQGTLDAARGAQYRGLSRVSGLLAGVMAMSLVNLGQFQPARRWWRAARHAADASTDPVVRTWIRGHDATHALYDRRPLTIALTRADEALVIGGSAAYPGVTEALSARAQAYALLGRADEARDAVNHLADLYGQLPASATQDLGTAFGYPQHRLWHTTSYVGTHLGDTDTARQAQEHALTLYPASSRRSRAQVQLHAARCMVIDGYLDEGASHAQTVIDAVPVAHRTAMVLDMGRKVLDQVPVVERERSALAELREMLALPAGPVAP